MRTERRCAILACVVALAALPARRPGSVAKVTSSTRTTTSPTMASLQRGARNFVNYCLGCHSAKYVRYNRVAADIGITEQQLIDNLMFTGERPHDTMVERDQCRRRQPWFGVVPPDLSLVARSRGPDYIYSFLQSFYADPDQADRRQQPGAAGHGDAARALGVAGHRRKRSGKGEVDAQGNASKHFKEFKLAEPGKLAPEEFDAFVRDTVNFLDYVAEPVQLQAPVARLSS